jgi:hypothetical protein
MMEWDWGKNFQHITFEEYGEKLSGEPSMNPRGWEMIQNFYSPFGVTQFTPEIKCSKCAAIGEGGIHIGQSVREKKKVTKYFLRDVCYRCALAMAKNPNEMVCHMLNMLDDEQSGILKNSIWSISTRNTIYTDIYGIFFSVGEYKKNKSTFWALCNDKFLPHRFRSLEDAQKTVLEKSLRIIPLYQKKIEALFDMTSTLPKSKDQLKYEANDPIGWPK